MTSKSPKHWKHIISTYFELHSTLYALGLVVGCLGFLSSPVVIEPDHPQQCEMVVAGYLAAPADLCLLVRAGWRTV